MFCDLGGSVRVGRWGDGVMGRWMVEWWGGGIRHIRCTEKEGSSCKLRLDFGRIVENIWGRKREGSSCKLQLISFLEHVGRHRGDDAGGTTHTNVLCMRCADMKVCMGRAMMGETMIYLFTLSENTCIRRHPLWVHSAVGRRIADPYWIQFPGVKYWSLVIALQTTWLVIARARVSAPRPERETSNIARSLPFFVFLRHWALLLQSKDIHEFLELGKGVSRSTQQGWHQSQPKYSVRVAPLVQMVLSTFTKQIGYVYIFWVPQEANRGTR